MAFLGTNTWGIVGYTPQSAEALARNILLYSQNPAMGNADNKGAAEAK